MDEMPSAQPAVISMTRARTYAVDDPRAERRTQPPKTTGLDPNALRKRPTPYELLMQEQTNPGEQGPENDRENLEMDFAGGTVEISGEALARSLTPTEEPEADATAGVEADNTEENGLDEATTDFSPSSDNAYPDLGERVL